MQNTHSLKVGDKVRAVKAWPTWFEIGDVHTVDAVDVTGVIIKVRGERGWFNADYFEKVEEAAPQFKAGDRVRCIRATKYSTSLTNGAEYTVEKATSMFLSVAGSHQQWLADRFVKIEKSEPVAVEPTYRVVENGKGNWVVRKRVVSVSHHPVSTANVTRAEADVICKALNDAEAA